MSKDKINIPELRFPEFKNEEEWIPKTLGEIAIIKRGAASQHLKYVDKNHPLAIRLLRINDFLNNEAVYIENTDDIKRFRVKTDDILIAGTGATAGITFMVPLEFNDLAYSYNAPRIRVNDTDNYFVYYNLKSDSVIEQQKRMFVGNAQPFLDTTAIGNLKFSVPKNPKEQQKIASCLSSLDEVITAHSQKLELLKDHKKGLMQNLFPQEGEKVPKYRFPEFVNEGEWKENVLSNITDAIFDGTHQTPTYTESGVPFFSVENIVSGNKNKFISKEDYEIATNRFKPEKGDVLLTRIGKIGFSAIVDWDYEFSIYVTLACIKQSKLFNSYYLHSYFQSSSYQKEILSKSLLNAVPMKINMDELRKTRVLLPPDNEKKEQQKIASCLSSLDAIIKAQAEKIEQLKLHKKGLMQGLFPKMSNVKTGNALS